MAHRASGGTGALRERSSVLIPFGIVIHCYFRIPQWRESYQRVMAEYALLVTASRVAHALTNETLHLRGRHSYRARRLPGASRWIVPDDEILRLENRVGNHRIWA